MGMVSIKAGTQNLSLPEVSILETYRRYGLGGLAEMAVSNYRAEQTDIVYELNQKIQELEQRIENMREPIIDWTNEEKVSHE